MNDEWIVYVAFAAYSVSLIIIGVTAIREARRRHRELVQYYRSQRPRG